MICFDTTPLIWGIQGSANQGFEEMIHRTKAYIEHLAAKGKRILIPTPVLAEYLSGFSSHQDRIRQLETIEKSFIVAPFSMKAAVIAADLWNEIAFQANKRELAPAATGGKQKTKFDVQIVAIAIAEGAEALVTNDPHIKKIGQGRSIRIHGIPEISEQALFFDSNSPE